MTLMNNHIQSIEPNLLHDNPSLYDSFIPDPEHQMGRFLHTMLQHYNTGHRVLDIGSGLGREVHYLSQRGYTAVGLDESAAMIAWAQQHYSNACFIQGDQRNFALNEHFDAITCMGSTFLYNYTNEQILATLGCFHKHLVPGGLLLMDMRNAAFFLTEEGQQWLHQERTQTAQLPTGRLTATMRFELDLANQLLKRSYTWYVPDQAPIDEQLDHRLIFPQEMRCLLNISGFAVDTIFDEPAAHIGNFQEGDELTLRTSMQGSRMQIVARAL